MRLQKFLPLLRNSTQRRLPLEADAADDVMDVVAIQSAGGRQQDVIVLADFELVPFEDGRPVRVVLLDRDELEVVVVEIEEAGRRAVRRGIVIRPSLAERPWSRIAASPYSSGSCDR